MHKSFFLAFFMLLTTSLLAQSKPDKIENMGNRRSETYFFAETTYDSVRFTIKGKKDTVLKETFWRNGQFKIRDWGEDSLYNFSNQGLIESKHFYLKNKNNPDSIIVFHQNGGVQSVLAKKKNQFYRLTEFSLSGRKRLQRVDKFIGKCGTYSVQKDSNNHISYTSFSDTLLIDGKEKVWLTDTFFHPNGQPYLIRIHKISMGVDRNDVDRFEVIKCDFFDEKGQIIESMPPSNLHLSTFKDNVDCYYGLKTAKNDTIFKPRFDRVEQLRDNLMAAYEGTKCRLMHSDGTFITTPDMESVFELSDNMPSQGYYSRQQFSHIDRLMNEPNLTYYLKFTTGQKEGVINRKGELIVPPQYRSLSTFQGQLTDSLFAFTVYSKSVSLKDESREIEQGYVNRKGLSVLPNYIHADYLIENNYFKVSNSLESFISYSEERPNVMGVANTAGELILPCKFNDISSLDTSKFCRVYLKKEEESPKLSGIFDLEKRRWLVDTSGALTIEYTFDNAAFVVVFAPKTKKYGVIDAKGTYILPMIYDTLSVVSEKRQLFIARKGTIYQFLNLTPNRQRPDYEFLSEVSFKYSFNRNYDEIYAPVFLAKRNGKWGVIDSNDRVLYPFSGDFAAHEDNQLFLMENNAVHYFDEESFPNKASLFYLFRNTSERLISRRLADNSANLFFFNANGKVVIPPQYKALEHGYNEDDSYILVENAQNQRKMISKETGAIVDFPYDYTLQLTLPESKVLIVSDNKLNKKYPESAQNLGVITKEGRQITPCINAGIAIADARLGTYFVRPDTPTEHRGYNLFYGEFDSLYFADKNWFLYNAEGQLLDKTPFRFPISFNAYHNRTIGIGMKGELFGLFRADGSVVVPPQYQNIRQDSKTGYYYLFENRGLTSTVIVKRSDTTTLIEAGRYDAVSLFHGKYAFTRLAGKVGLIDTFGREVIAPQDLYTFNKINLLDSIGLFNKELDKKIDSLGERGATYFFRNQQSTLPITFRSSFSPDSLNISASLRNSFWHLMLEKIQGKGLWQVGDINISRSSMRRGMYYQRSGGCGNGKLTEGQKLAFIGYRAKASENLLSFVLRSYKHTPHAFYNFYFKNNRWNDLTINELLTIQGEKRGQFNEALIQKVRALKGEEIDCSNTSAFVAQVENRFMITKEGVEFCFESKGDRSEFVVVSFTWAELAPFLKMRL